MLRVLVIIVSLSTTIAVWSQDVMTSEDFCPSSSFTMGCSRETAPRETKKVTIKIARQYCKTLYGLSYQFEDFSSSDEIICKNTRNGLDVYRHLRTDFCQRMFGHRFMIDVANPGSYSCVRW